MVFFHLVVSNTHTQTLCRRRRLFIWPDDFSLLANLYYYLCVCWVSDSQNTITHIHAQTLTKTLQRVFVCLCVRAHYLASMQPQQQILFTVNSSFSIEIRSWYVIFLSFGLVLSVCLSMHTELHVSAAMNRILTSIASYPVYRSNRRLFMI